MKPVTAAIIGAGGRGLLTYGAYAESFPYDLKVVGVAEPHREKRALIVDRFQIPQKYVFQDWKDLLAAPKFADVVFICTQDQMHVQPALAAMKAGYHILLEKPIAPTAEECLHVQQEARSYDLSIAVAHVLRYTPFFSTIKELIDGGAIGAVRGIQHNENVGHIHYSHSFVRGNWHSKKESSPMILAKSCHDMDILLYLAGADCRKVSSFGSRGTFTSEKRPPGAPDRCLDGCPHRVSCPYFAPKVYLTGSTDWPVSAVTEDLTPTGILAALETGPYGRCVYACDNDMTEHQVVNLEFENGITAAFSMSAFTAETCRTIKIVGEEGEIRGAMERQEIEVSSFSERKIKTISLARALDAKGHGGGDERLVRDFILHLRDRRKPLSSSLERAVQSHLMAFAAEDSMSEGRVIDMTRYTS